jgi:hypothetical protein
MGIDRYRRMGGANSRDAASLMPIASASVPCRLLIRGAYVVGVDRASTACGRSLPCVNRRP